MSALIFTHGTGTRRASYDKALAVVTEQARVYLPGWEVIECYWGEPYGSRQWIASLPEGPTSQEVQEAEDVVLWRRLLEDPFFQLRLLEAAPQPAAAAFSLSETSGELLWKKLEDLELPAEADTILRDNDLMSFWAAALANVLTESESAASTNLRWKPVIESAGTTQAEETRTAVANCLIAQSITLASSLWVPPLSYQDRNRLKELIVDALGGGDKGIGSFLSKVLLGAALVAANPAIRADRGGFSTDTGPATGDILLYQARGEKIRSFIKQRIEEESATHGPVLVVGHSLGGIAALDLLIANDLWSHVRALVTVGSQAPYLYEIGALWSLEKTETSTLPAHFPRKHWLNILNRWDFLSYPAQKVFPKHATDREVSSPLPFPVSHSAYWKNGDTWRHVADFLK